MKVFGEIGNLLGREKTMLCFAKFIIREYLECK